MKNRIFNIVIITICVIILIFSIFNIFTSNEIQNEYPIYDNLKVVPDEKEPEVIEQEMKDLRYAVPIFMYHWVRDDTGDYPYPENMVRPETLKAQLQYLKDNNYESIYITDLKNIASYSKPIALTFDDGFICFYLYAYPLLKEYNIKSTLFVITDYVGTPGYCTLEQLIEMKNSGVVDIQAHTATHPYLATLSVNDMFTQMNSCNQYLKEKLNINSNVICYPYGSYNFNTIAQAKKIGYEYGLAMDGGVHYSYRDDKYEISRIYANRSMNLNTFANYCKKSFVEVLW